MGADLGVPLSDLRLLCVSVAGGESRKTFTQFSKRENVKTFLYILAHRRTLHGFEMLGSNPSDEAFNFRRGQYFWHMRASPISFSSTSTVSSGRPSSLRGTVTPAPATRRPS